MSGITGIGGAGGVGPIADDDSVAVAEAVPEVEASSSTAAPSTLLDSVPQLVNPDPSIRADAEAVVDAAFKKDPGQAITAMRSELPGGDFDIAMQELATRQLRTTGQAAGMAMGLAATDPKALGDLARATTPENRAAMAAAVLGDPNLTSQQAAGALTEVMRGMSPKEKTAFVEDMLQDPAASPAFLATLAESKSLKGALAGVDPAVLGTLVARMEEQAEAAAENPDAIDISRVGVTKSASASETVSAAVTAGVEVEAGVPVFAKATATIETSASKEQGAALGIDKDLNAEELQVRRQRNKAGMKQLFDAAGAIRSGPAGRDPAFKEAAGDKREVPDIKTEG